MTPITYVDHDPLIPTHLGTDAPHVHHLGSDRCLRIPDGEHCPTPAELRAEVDRLTADIDECWVPLYHGEVHERRQAEARAESAEAERDALQQQVGKIAQRLIDLASETHSIGLKSALLAVSRMVDADLLAALGDPAAPPRWDEETAALFVDAARRAAPPQEPQPTPEAHVHSPGGCYSDPTEALWRQMDLARQSEPVERITDANGDETERGADTDTPTHQQDGDHR